MKGKDLFCSSLFRDPTSTSVFYTFIAQLKRSIDLAHPSPTHLFLRTLDEKKRLLRSYTQNIDGFEERIGLTGSGSERARAKGKGKGKLLAKEVRNVQLHGDIHRVRCGLCSCNLPCTEEYLTMFDDGSAPNCPECTQRCEFSPLDLLLELHSFTCAQPRPASLVLLVPSRSEHCVPLSCFTTNHIHSEMTLVPCTPPTLVVDRICLS